MENPDEGDSIDCHFQKVGTSGLVCRAAKRNGKNVTKKTTPKICFNCPAGKVYREVGCDSVSTQVSLSKTIDDVVYNFGDLFCQKKKRYTSLEKCKNCNLVTAETTKEIVYEAKSLFERHDFYTAYQDLEEARVNIRDGKFDDAITRCLSSLESTMKIYHEKLDIELPQKETATKLWKSTRETMNFYEIDSTGSVEDLLNALSGTTTKFAGLRNVLGDAHGKGLESPEASETIAELAINISATLSTFILRRFNQLRREENE